MNDKKKKTLKTSNDNTQKYALWAIILPFIGVLFGASLEHGTNFLCKLRVVDCKISETEVTHLRKTASSAQENLRKTIEVMKLCQSTLAGVSAKVQNTNSTIPSSINVTGLGSRQVSLGRFKSRLDSLSSELQKDSQKINRNICEISKAC